MFTPDPLREFDSETDADERRWEKRIIARKDARIAELEDENKRLRCEIEKRVAEGYPSTPSVAVPDLRLLETQAQSRFFGILYSGGAGSPEAHAARTELMAASAARATQDAQDTAKTSEGDTGVKFNYAPTLAQHVSSEGWEL